MADRPRGGHGAEVLARARLSLLVGTEVVACQPAGGDHGASHYRAALADGREMFVKQGPGPQIAAEASGLAWLAEAGAVPIPRVLGSGDGVLALEYVPPGQPDPATATRFGRDLAVLHAAGAPCFGARWAGFIAGLPLPNEPGQPGEPWGSWYARCRLTPYVRRARDAGLLGQGDVALLDSVADRIGELAGPDEPPSRIHGDCWSGNVLWSGGRGWLVDPAAHGGHRETDLAMVALFGASYLSQVLAGYQETAPLAAGWPARVPLHQMHPLLVHVCLFGSGYTGPLLAAARAALAA